MNSTSGLQPTSQSSPESDPQATPQATLKTVSELFASIDPLTLLQGAKNSTERVSHITHDSRLVTPGCIFVALSGEYFDGHRFFAEVVEKGAVALIGSRGLTDMVDDGMRIPDTIPYGMVPNPRVALAQLAASFYNFPSSSMTVIGVTGTDGKTTTANILESILVQATIEPDFPHGRVGVISTVAARMCGRESDTGFHVTTPDAPAVQRYLAEMQAAGCTYAIIESTSQGIAQHRVDAVDFDVAAVTNITHEHIDWHGSRAAYIDAKADLFRMLYRTDNPATDNKNYQEDQGGEQCNLPSRWAILNADDRGTPDYPGSYEALTAVLGQCAVTSDAVVQYLSYNVAQENGPEEKGTEENTPIDNANVWAEDVAYRPDKTTFVLKWSQGSERHANARRLEIRTSLLGDFNVQNILCAASVALALDVAPEAIREGIAGLGGVLGRMERIDCGQPFLAIVDFAHSPASLERALLTLRRLLTAQSQESARPARIIAVFGSAGLRDVEKRRLMGQVSGRLADFTIVTAEDPRTEDLADINCEIAQGLLDETDSDSFSVIPDRSEALQRAVQLANPGDVVAAFGKGHERSMCFGTTEYPWNEQEAMMQALRLAGYGQTDEGVKG